MFNQTIRQKLVNICFLIVCLTAGSGYLTHYAFSKLAQERASASLAMRIIEGVFELTILSQDYFISPTGRAASQWRMRHESLLKLVSQIDIKDTKITILHEKLITSIGQLKNIFSLLDAQFTESPNIIEAHQRSAALKAHTLKVAQGITNLAHQYASYIEIKANDIERRAFLFLLTSSIVVALIILGLVLLIKQTLSESIMKLERGIELLEEGASIKMVRRLSNDEFSQVFASFEKMSRKVSERHQRVIADLSEAKNLAQRSNKAKSDFLANVSHEIRTPLSIIDGYISLLNNPDFKEKETIIEKVHWNVTFLTNLISDILDLSKIESGKFRTSCEVFNLRDEIKTMLEALKHSAEAKRVKLHINCQTPIPLLINSDKLRLEQILFNIVGNAIKFTDHGSVIVTLEQKDGQLFFTVKDTGIGISSEQQSKLFSIFAQADATVTRKFGGTGLGLVLSRKLAEALGGNVYIAESEPEKGSTFVIQIPIGKIESNETFISFDLLEKDSKPTNDMEQKDLENMSNSSLTGARILLAEDCEDLRDLFSFQLRRFGAEVIEVANGQEAVDFFAQDQQFDLLLMDVQMPVMDGYTAAKIIRGRHPATPIIACSARIMKEEKQQGAEAGITDYLEKPVNLTKLVEVCAKHRHRTLS